VRRGEKEVLRAGLVNYVQRKLQRDLATLADLRQSMHDLRRKKPSRDWQYAYADWHTFHGLASTQVLVIRRRRLQLEAAKLWDIMRTNNLIVSAAPKHGGLMRYEQRPRATELAGRVTEMLDDLASFNPNAEMDPTSVDACIARMKRDEARIADLPDPEQCPLEELEDDMLEAIATMQGGNELARSEAREARRILDQRHTHPLGL
jgi:hypothetical protein